MFKSRTLRRVKKVTPGGRVSRRFVQRKPTIIHCGRCGAPLSGVARMRAGQAHGLAKTKKRPQRPFGGVLCSRCLRDMIKAEAREK